MLSLQQFKISHHQRLVPVFNGLAAASDYRSIIMPCYVRPSTANCSRGKKEKEDTTSCELVTSNCWYCITNFTQIFTVKTKWTYVTASGQHRVSLFIPRLTRLTVQKLSSQRKLNAEKQRPVAPITSKIYRASNVRETSHMREPKDEVMS